MIATNQHLRFAMFKNILLATAGSAASEHVAQPAIDLARSQGPDRPMLGSVAAKLVATSPVPVLVACWRRCFR